MGKAKHLDRVEIKILPSAPVTADDFKAAYSHHKRGRLNTGMMAFFRHSCTNYDKVMENSFNRYGVHPDVEAKDKLRVHINALSLWYFREIGLDISETSQSRHLVVSRVGELDSA